MEVLTLNENIASVNKLLNTLKHKMKSEVFFYILKQNSLYGKCFLNTK